MELKLPHWAGIAISLAAVIVTWATAEQSSGHLVLPAAVVTALIVASKILGLLSVRVSPAANARAVRATGALVIAPSVTGTMVPPAPDSTIEVTQPDVLAARKP